MFVRETYINKTEGYRFGERDWTDEGDVTRGAIYRRSREEYGRCVSKVYVDRPGRPPLAVGWVFEKRMKYEDCNDTYVREVWVTIAKSVEPARKPQPIYE